MARTRRRKSRQRGGEKCGKDDQIQHAISQLKRFAERAKDGKEFRALQFGYNLGRLQEMLHCGEKGMNKIWWSPLEPLVEEQDWKALSKKIDELRVRTGVAYDEATVKKQ